MLFLLSQVGCLAKRRSPRVFTALTEHRTTTLKHMSTNETKEFFECLGEITRDVSQVEFLMRCAITKHDGQEPLFPTPPYTEGRVYSRCPDAFREPLSSFGKVQKRFNVCYPDHKVPLEVKWLRDAMAHGLFAEVNHSGALELVKFRDQHDGALKVEFGRSYTLEQLQGIRLHLAQFCRHLRQLINTTPNAVV